MDLASVVLSLPIILTGIEKTTQLIATADLRLKANWEHSTLEIYQWGKLVRVRPLTGVLDMVPNEKQAPCPECSQSFEDARALGAHLRHKHGVRGATHS